MPEQLVIDRREASGGPEGEQSAADGSASSLTLAGIAALLASTCCVLPLVFAIVGVSGAWIAQLHRMEPYSYPLTALAAAALAVAGWRIWRPAAGDARQCDLEACRQRNAAARRWFWVLAVLTVLPLAVRQVAHFFY
jgi:mercuric ion transport protein